MLDMSQDDTFNYNNWELRNSDDTITIIQTEND